MSRHRNHITIDSHTIRRRMIGWLVAALILSPIVLLVMYLMPGWWRLIGGILLLVMASGSAMLAGSWLGYGFGADAKERDWSRLLLGAIDGPAYAAVVWKRGLGWYARVAVASRDADLNVVGTGVFAYKLEDLERNMYDEIGRIVGDNNFHLMMLDAAHPCSS